LARKVSEFGSIVVERTGIGGWYSSGAGFGVAFLSPTWEE
jgi:hypothetical protein